MKCSACGTENPASNSTCSSCGVALQASNPSSTSQSSSGSVSAFLLSANKEGAGFGGGLIILLFCAVLSLVGWFPLSLPSRGIRALVDMIGIQGCADLTPGTLEMYLCSAKIGLVVLIGPILMMVLIFLLRKPLARLVHNLTPKLPEGVRFLAAPALATIIFTIAWSGAHKDTSFQMGILPQIIFPAVVGLYTYVLARYASGLQNLFGGFFDFRDKIPNWLRFVIVIAIPILLGLAITTGDSVGGGPLKEQFVVLVALVNGYLFLAPRSQVSATKVQQA